MNSSRPTRVLIVDDQQLVAEICKTFLEPKFKVVGIVNDAHAMVREAARLKPEIVLVDLAIPLLNELNACEQVKKRNPEVKLVFLTMNFRPEVVAEAFHRGASAYVPKSAAAQELVTALEEVRRGRIYLSPLIARETYDFLLRGGKSPAPQKTLTARQREVLQLLAEGKKMREVAQALQLKPGTIAFHKYRIMRVLEVRTNAELLQYAAKYHLTSE
jgi:DNA-binding NarL/FixJ family response regulator